MALPRKQQHVGDRPTREIYDAEGRSWVLGEVPSHLKDGTVEIALVAEDGDLIRRFSQFPPTWYQLSDEALIRLIQSPSGDARDGDERDDHRSKPAG